MGKRLFYWVLLFLLCLLQACTDKGKNEVTPPVTPTGEDFSIGSGDPELVLHRVDQVGYKVTISAYGNKYIAQNSAAVSLQVFPVGVQSSKWYEVPYQEVEKQGDRLVCKARVKTDEGSEFAIQDTYSMDNAKHSLQLSRKINVLKESGKDHAFNSYVILQNEQPKAVTNCEYFIPSLVYVDQSNLSDTSIGADFGHDWILAREERMGLPLAMMREKDSGCTVSLIDHNLNPATFKGDFGAGHLVNDQMKFASLGYFLGDKKASLAYCYPGSEGERTYADGTSYREKRWARRSHPVKQEVEHAYTLQIHFSESADFPQALESHWKHAFDLFNPQPLDVVSEQVLSQGLEVLDHYWTDRGGAPGFPFSVHLPGGDVYETSYAMGFVGMQISCAYYLYRQGIETGNDTYKRKGEQIIDFWAKNSLSADGIPRVWWDVSPWNLFRNYNDLRNMQGGLEAMIWAWGCAEEHTPGIKQQWLDYCIRAAEWLLDKQHPDGSWDKAYNNAGQSVDSGKFLTSNLIRFLCYLYDGTGDERYRSAALKAGEFCYQQLHEPYKYVGSVIDNPYVKDRESGQKMIEAFLCLYDLTGEGKWLHGARQAAYYTVTYMYAWNIPTETGDKPFEWPADKSSVGLTIIATGHSGADCGFSYNSFEFLRLYILTGDTYLLRIAELLEKNTKQTMNYDGSLGYAFKGLQTEAIRIVTPRGYGVRLWLPWVTASALDPLFKMKDAYNSMDVMSIASRPLSELQRMDKEYAKHHGIKK